MVWGLGYERNEVTSPPLLNRDDALVVNEARLFGNLEWRPHERWLINAGGYWGRHSWTGSDFSPRLMANFQVVPDHTLRAGVSRSVRTPNLLELAADVRYYPRDYVGLLAAGKVAEAAAAFWNIPYRTMFSDGTVQPEKLRTSELGYFGNLRDLRMTLDVRIYHERMMQLIDVSKTEIPGYVTLANSFGIPAGLPIPVETFANSPGFRIRGLEYQLRWKALPRTEIWLNQSYQKLTWDNDASEEYMNMPPAHATTVAWFQKLPHEMDFSLMLHSWDDMSWGNRKDRLPSRRRLDARLAWPFRIGSTHGEMAITVQAADGNYPEYLLRRGYEFERRAFGTLRLEF
jgi:iron complex outermembrane receptor protein